MRKIIEYVLVSTDGVYEDPVGMMRVGESGLQSKYFGCSGRGVSGGWCAVTGPFGLSLWLPALVAGYRQ
jgi:hypothetical protein